MKKPTPPADISTYRKQGTDYFTSEGIVIRTGYNNKRDWYLFPIREMLDNSMDFLWKHYKGSDNALISVDIIMDDDIFHLKIRNTNHKNVPVLKNLEAIFDFNMRYGSKQDVHIISRGMLGDALKQILSLGYVLLHIDDDGTEFENKQWAHPLIIRHNNEEFSVLLNFDRAEQGYYISVVKSDREIEFTDTEIELKLPVIDEVHDTLTRDVIEEFYRKNILLSTDISFNFSIIDDISHSKQQIQALNDDEIAKEFMNKFTKVPEKGILHIHTPALHPISKDKDWVNADSVHSYKAEEFMRRVTNVHDKSKSVYDVLQNFREGSQIKKTPENQITISELLLMQDRDKIMEKLYEQLRDALPALKELSLPYSTYSKTRGEILYSRVKESKFYDIDIEKRYSYKLVKAEYNDGNIRYPYAFEILAIPVKNPLIQNSPARQKDIIFIGAINYSVSPKPNVFEYEENFYEEFGFSNNSRELATRKNIISILHKNGFAPWNHPDNKVRIPCVVIGNLITPKREPLGHDKSSIDVQPFIAGIKEAVKKMSTKIQTYRQIGHSFTNYHEHKNARFVGVNRTNQSGIASVRQFLVKEFGLPDR